MKKELSPSLEMVACDVCGRTILKGEHTEPYMVPDGSRRVVCELCIRRAESAGWLRESAYGDLPAAAPRAEPRRSLLGRLRRRHETEPPAPDAVPVEPGDAYAAEQVEKPAEAPVQPPDEVRAFDESLPIEAEHRPRVRRPAVDASAGARPPIEEPAPADDELSELLDEPSREELRLEVDPRLDPREARRERRSRRRVRDPRHVRAVPTGAEAKVEQALEIFNLSDYRRTVGGLVRTLGPPWVTALPHEGSTGEVTVVVAWELSWYQFRIDLGDADEPVAVADKGHEVEEIDAELRRWNAIATDDGALEVGVPAA